MPHFVNKQYCFFWYIHYNIETFVNNVILKTNSYEKLCKKRESRKKKFFISGHKNLRRQKRFVAIVIISKIWRIYNGICQKPPRIKRTEYRNNGLNLFKNTFYMCTMSLTKLKKFRTRRIHVAHCRMPNVTYTWI